MALTFSDTFTLSNLTIAAGSQVTLNAIAGDNFTKSGIGTLILSGGNNLLSPTGTLTITDGVFDLGSYSHATSGTITFQGGTVQNGTIINTGTDYIGQSGTVAAILDGSVGLTKTTSGTLVLSSANTYDGATTINGGTLQLSGEGSLPNTTSVILADVAGATLDLNGKEQTISGLYGGGDIGGWVELGDGGQLTVNNDYSNTFYGRITNLAGGKLVKEGSGTLILSGANTYTGTTTISSGVLELAPTGRISTASEIYVSPTAIFKVNGGIHTMGIISGAGIIVIGDGIVATTVYGDSVSAQAGAIRGRFAGARRQTQHR